MDTCILCAQLSRGASGEDRIRLCNVSQHDRKTVTLIGANPANVRMWSAESDKKMPGSAIFRKPDVVARAQGSELDWRNLDCVVEMKNGKVDQAKDRLSWCELAEHAKFLFGLQHDRR